jgi:hypothetical protein
VAVTAVSDPLAPSRNWAVRKTSTALLASVMSALRAAAVPGLTNRIAFAAMTRPPAAERRTNQRMDMAKA